MDKFHAESIDNIASERKWGGTPCSPKATFGMLGSVVTGIVKFCTRFPWPIIVLAVIATAGSAVYAARNFAINTDVNKLISSELDWRKGEADVEKAYQETLGCTL